MRIVMLLLQLFYSMSINYEFWIRAETIVVNAGLLSELFNFVDYIFYFSGALYSSGDQPVACSSRTVVTRIILCIYCFSVQP